MKKLFFFNATLILNFLLPTFLLAQPGTLDVTFGSGGIVTTSIGSNYDIGNSVAIQMDGKIIVAGQTYNGAYNDLALVRYNSNGSLDNTFGFGGKVTADIGDVDDYFKSVVIQNNGKIVVAGQSSNGINATFTLVRYNTNGILDNTFGSNGIVKTPVGFEDASGQSACIQTNGKMLVAGYSCYGSNCNFALVRYNDNGSLDNFFGSGGIVITSIGTANSYGSSAKIQTDGKIIVAGYTTLNYFSGPADFALVRYDSSGILDNSFGVGGIVTTDIGSLNDYAFSAAIQTDGKILVAGYSKGGLYENFTLVRYNSNGNMDTTFGIGGIVTTAIGSGHGNAWSVVIQTDGKILIAGRSYSYLSYYDFALVRYNSDGSLDNSFGLGGIVTTAIGSGSCGNSSALQTDDKIVVAGTAGDDFALARFNTTITGVKELSNEHLTIEIYPNPFTSQTTIAFYEEQKNITIKIFDLLGKQIKKIDFTGNKLIFEKEEMQKGIYIVQITDENKNLINKKIVIQ